MTRYLKLSAVAVAALVAGPAWAEFPNDENITFVIPYSPGGGFDTIVRTYAPALEEALGATVVPENIPGASGTRGGQAVYRADPDGYTIGIFNIPGLTVSEATERDIGFPLGEITWIANLAEEQYAIAVKTDSPIQSVADLCAMGQPIKLSDTGVDSTSSITAVISFDILDCPIVNVTGYGGSNDTMIAVMRGEVDATLKPIGSLAKYVESGDLRYIFTLTDSTAIEGVESAADIGHPELAKFTINRVVGGPPNMPADVVTALSDALKVATESAPVQEWASGTGTSLSYLPADATTAKMGDLSTFYAQYKGLLAPK
jgi:tripartite-type tricarboxylate transporter receptor subunit TctC